MNKSFLIAGIAAVTAGQALLAPARPLSSAAPPQRAAQVRGADATQGGGLEVVVTLAEFSGDANECGSATSLEANIGDQVNVCYTLINHGTETLHYQSLTDSVDGAVLTYEPITIAPGQSHPYVRTIVATGDSERTASWTGYVGLASYAADASVAPNFIDISAIGSDTGILDGAGGGADPNNVGEVTAGFPLRFYGRTSTALCVSADGLILFDDATCAVPFPGAQPPPGYSFNQDIPTTFGLEVPSYLAPMWMNLDNGPGRLYAATIGTAPNRKFVLQWNDVWSYAIATSGATFEVVFSEDSDAIRFEYAATAFGNEADDGAWATVGLQGDPAGLYTKYSYYQPSLAPHSAIQWNYTAPVSYGAESAPADISAGLPAIAIPTAAVDAVVAPGGSATGTLTIRNTGNRDLHWDLAQAPGGARAHFPKTVRHVKTPVAHSLPARARPLSGVAHADHPPLSPAPRAPAGSAAVPAYGISSLLPGLVGFDALDPLTTYTRLNDSSDWIYAAAFVGNDFGKLYVIVNDSWELPPGTYGTIDTATGAFTELGRIDGADHVWWSGLVQDPLTGTVYGVNYDDGGFSDAAATLYTIDLASGHAVRIGAIDGPGVSPMHFISTIAIGPNGLMYGLDLYGQQLLAIDKTSGAASVIESLGLDVQYVQSIAFDQRSGSLYWAALYNDGSGNPVSEIRVIDPLTAASQPIGPLPAAGEYPIDELSALAIATPAVGCAAPGSVPWLSFDSTSGTIAAGAPERNVTVSFDSSGLAPGLHQATICVQSDDPRRPTVAVPVALAVSDAVLYDQNTTGTPLRAFNNTVVAPEGTAGLSAEGADDFVVEGPGWSVTSFSFSAYGNAANPMPPTVNVAVHADDGGRPGAALCEAAKVPAIALGDATGQIGVWLPSACALPPGTYWVVWSFADVNIASPVLGFWGQVTAQHNQPAVWRNPGGMLSPGCTSWSTFDQCPDQFPDGTAKDFGFTVFGRSGGDCTDTVFADGFDGGGACTAGRAGRRD
jgi:hypothetical protein